MSQFKVNLENFHKCRGCGTYWSKEYLKHKDICPNCDISYGNLKSIEEIRSE